MSKPLNRRSMLQLGMVGSVGALGGALLPQNDPECVTPSQTSGPFYPTRDQLDKDIDLTVIEGRTDRAQGEVILINGQVLADDLQPVPGALVEIWQANTHGRYHHEADPNPAPEDPAFQGWGQVRADAEGRYSFKTIIPGAYPANESTGWWRPPHIHFKVARRGYHELVTQMYFAGHDLNDADLILQGTPEEDRDRLVVTLYEAEDDSDVRHGTFTIVLQRVEQG